MMLKLKKEYLNYIINILINVDDVTDVEVLSLILVDDEIVNKLNPYMLSKSSKFLSFGDWIVERRKEIIDNI